jgi:hypothetical protein
VGLWAPAPDNRGVTALTIGITAARFAECKRGLAANLAASLARDPSRGQVCVVDADPLTLDVTTRFAVRGPYLEDFAELVVPLVGTLGSVHEPPLAVLPSSGASVGVTQRAMEQALPQLRAHFDVVVCDLMGGPGGPTRGVGRLAQLDWLLIALTPDVEPVEATACFLERLAAARERGEVAPSVRVGIVATGDEGSVARHGPTDLSSDVMARSLGCPVVGSIRQLWGRCPPNLGFGAALEIAELDDAVGALCARLTGPTDPVEPVFTHVS